MKKRWIFLAAAVVLGAVFLWGVLSAGARSQWFGIEKLRREAEGAVEEETDYRYVNEWDPADSPVRGLDIHWINGRVTVSRWDGETVRITESCAGPDLSNDDKLKLSSSGGVLEIGWNKRLISLAVLENRRKDLEILVPNMIRTEPFRLIRCENTSGDIELGEGFSAEKLVLASSSGQIRVPQSYQGGSADISTTSGEIQLRNVDLSEELKVRSVEGNIHVEQCACEQAAFKNTSGWVNFSGLVRSAEAADGLTVDTVSGKVTLELDEMPAKTQVRTVSGDVVIAAGEKDGYTLTYETVSGKLVDEAGLSPTGTERKYIAGDGKAELTVATTDGDLTVAHFQPEG